VKPSVRSIVALRCITAAIRQLRVHLSRGQFRTREQILGFFGDLELVSPGFVIVSDWRPDADTARAEDQAPGARPGFVCAA